jgi:hypothetical protein
VSVSQAQTSGAGLFGKGAEAMVHHSVEGVAAAKPLVRFALVEPEVENSLGPDAGAGIAHARFWLAA